MDKNDIFNLVEVVVVIEFILKFEGDWELG